MKNEVKRKMTIQFVRSRCTKVTRANFFMQKSMKIFERNHVDFNSGEVSVQKRCRVERATTALVRCALVRDESVRALQQREAFLASQHL